MIRSGIACRDSLADAGWFSSLQSSGDLHLRPAGLISTPEFSAWQMLNRTQDSFLVLVSDGATEALSAAQICQIAAANASGKSHSRGSTKTALCSGIIWCHTKSDLQCTHHLSI